MKKILLPAAIVFLFLIVINTISVAQLRPEIAWQKCLGGTGDDRAQDVLINPDGTFLVVGSTTSNDGDVSGQHGLADAWMVKLSADGNVLWQKSIGGSLNDYFKTIIATNDNAYLCIGNTSSANGDVSGNHGSGDAWIVKISEAGNIIWSKCYGGSAIDNAVKAITTPDGNYAVIGTSTSVNGDLGSGGNGAWVFKINNSGNIIWTTGLGSIAGKTGYDIMLSGDNNIYALASDYYTYILTAGVPPVDYTMVATPGKFYKIDNATGNGTLLATINSDSAWSMCSVNNSIKISHLKESYFYVEYCWDEDFYIATAPDGSFNFTSQELGGQFTRSCSNAFNDGNFTATTHGLAAAETGSGLVAVGTYLVRSGWSMQPKGWITDISGFSSYYSGDGFSDFETHFNSVKVFSTGNEYIVAGYTNDNGADISGNHGGNDCWVVKLSGLNRITGNIFIDANNNNIKDPGELPYNHVSIRSEKPGFQRIAIPFNGIYNNTVDIGTFTTTPSLSRPYYTITPANKISTFATYKNTDSANFAVHPVPGIIDYSVAVSTLLTVRPGFPVQYSIHYDNRGTTQLVNKNVVFIKDPREQFTSAVPPYTVISGDSIKWNIASLPPDGNGNIVLDLLLDPIPDVNINDTIRSAVYIDSIADVYRADNFISIRDPVSGSYDPNDKREIHGGYITPAELSQGDWLSYTIRFQNTGNDTAFNITVRDTLDPKLQWDSIEVISASHPYQFNIKDRQFINCTFVNIKLADSVHNEPLSHGFISYRIKPKPSLVLGDTIRNSASIYFDFNPPVRTNTEFTVVRNRPVQAQWTGAVSTAWENPGNWSNSLVPDENTDVTINTGVPRYPVVSSAAICRSVNTKPGTNILVKTGFALKIIH